jgi:hypothetical protein
MHCLLQLCAVTATTVDVCLCVRSSPRFVRSAIGYVTIPISPHITTAKASWYNLVGPDGGAVGALHLAVWCQPTIQSLTGIMPLEDATGYVP